MSIRMAVKADIMKVERIYEAVHSAESEGKLHTGWIKNIYPVITTAETAQANGHLFVLEEDGKVKGAGIINRVQHQSYSLGNWQDTASADSCMVLHTLVINPAYSGQGHGRAFVRFYAKYALDNSCENLRLDTNSINTEARAFYARMGFREAGTVLTPFNGIMNVRLVLLEAKARKILSI